MSFWYLASPYSKYKQGIYVAFEEVCAQTALLVSAGVKVYSPIAHTHPVAIHGNLDPLDHSIWLEADRAFMDTACGLIVCEMQGWRESYGVQHEIDYFKKQGKPIVRMVPGYVPDEVLTKQRQIIGLCGYAGVGKDTAAQGLIEQGWTRVALADGVRDAALAIDPPVAWTRADSKIERLSESLSLCNGDWTEAKQIPEVRRLLQRLGTEAGRAIHGDDCWIKIAKRKIDAAPGNVVITDVRFANEAEAIRSWGGKIIRIDREGVGPCNGHTSETLAFLPDEVIANDGTPERLQNNLCLAAGENIPLKRHCNGGYFAEVGPAR